MTKIFSEKDLAEIKSAVQKAESKTSGEIATAFIEESYNYSIYELIFAIGMGSLYFLIMSFFWFPLKDILSSLFWVEITFDRILLLSYGITTILVVYIFFRIANIPFIDRLIIPKKTRNKFVRERAIRHFFSSGIRNTKDRTGILIFISALERRVELLADSGISEKIEQAQWQEIVDNILLGIKRKKLKQHLIKSIEMCGKLLSEHFPIQQNDKNELDDNLQILEK